MVAGGGGGFLLLQALGRVQPQISAVAWACCAAAGAGQVPGG